MVAKIKEFLTEINVVNDSLIDKLNSTTSFSTERNEPIRNILFLEAQCTILELKNLLDQLPDEEVSFQTLQPFLEFLKQRWERISNTCLAYPYGYSNSSATQMCLTLAETLAGALSQLHHLSKPEDVVNAGISSYQLLMPTVTTKESLMGTLFTGSDLKLHEFILSDDNKRFIEVKECLSASRGDGILRDTSEVGADKKNRQLSADEERRIGTHSNIANKYYNLMKKEVHLEETGKSVGSYLRRLQKGLIGGGKTEGAHEGATDDGAGHTARLAIAEFGEFFNRLDQKEKDFLLNKIIGFKSLWNSLSAQGQTLGTCVELASKDITYIFTGVFKLMQRHTDIQHTLQLLAYHYQARVDFFLQKENAFTIRNPLTLREIECLQLTAQHKTAKEIARLLHISPRTVGFHLENTFKKLNVANKYQAVTKAIQCGFLD